MIKKNLANIITCTRIIGTVFMAIFGVLTKPFLIAYIYSGLSDVVDGFIARKLKIESDLGRKLDSVSDLGFYVVMMIKIWPYLVKSLSPFMWNIIWIICGIRICLYIYTQLMHHELLASHSLLNKATGFVMFFLPFMVDRVEFVAYSSMVITVALIAAIYEIFEVVKRK